MLFIVGYRIFQKWNILIFGGILGILCHLKLRYIELARVEGGGYELFTLPSFEISLKEYIGLLLNIIEKIKFLVVHDC